MNNNREQFIFGKYILLAGLILVSAGLAYITWWSFWQTQAWFGFLDFDGNRWVSDALAVVFQYGQGAALFLRSLMNLRKMSLEADLRSGRIGRASAEYETVKYGIRTTGYSMNGLLFTFFIFAGVDAWTNVAQMHAGLDAKALQGFVFGGDKYFFTAVIGIVAVFVEEGLGVMVSLATHVYNDIRVVLGHPRIKWLDVFGDGAAMTGGTTSFNTNQNRHNQQNQPRRNSNQFRPTARPVVNTNGGGRATPTRQQGDFYITNERTEEETDEAF